MLPRNWRMLDMRLRCDEPAQGRFPARIRERATSEGRLLLEVLTLRQKHLTIGMQLYQLECGASVDANPRCEIGEPAAPQLVVDARDVQSFRLGKPFKEGVLRCASDLLSG